MDKKRIKNKDSGVVVCWLLCICILDKKLVVWSDWLGKFWFVVVFVICILLSIVTCPINLPTLKVTPLSFSSEFTLKFLRTPFVLHVPFAWRGKLVWNRAKSTVIRKKKKFSNLFDDGLVETTATVLFHMSVTPATSQTWAEVLTQFHQRAELSQTWDVGVAVDMVPYSEDAGWVLT